MKRISGRQWSLKPQDLAMAFKLELDTWVGPS